MEKETQNSMNGTEWDRFFGTTRADFEEDRSMFICCVYCRVSLHVKAELCSLMAVNQTGLATLVEKRRRWETTITWRWEHTLFFPSAGKSSDSKLSLWSLAWLGSCVVLWKRGGWYDWNGNAIPVSALFISYFFNLKSHILIYLQFEHLSLTE